MEMGRAVLLQVREDLKRRIINVKERFGNAVLVAAKIGLLSSLSSQSTGPRPQESVLASARDQGGGVVTNDVSPYLQRPVRTLEEVILEAEQQRLEQAREAANGPFA